MRSLVSEIVGNAHVIPVLVIDNLKDAVPLAQCLVSNGLPVLEVTMRTECALAAIEQIAKEVEGAVVGAGTILNEKDLQAAKDAGAAFGVSPGVSRDLLEALEKTDLPFLPGVATIGEVMTLRDAGFSEQKLFPAEILGGAAYVKGIGGPIKDVSFCPTGGIKIDTMKDYLRLDNVLAIGGTWIAPADLVQTNNWEEIGERALTAARRANSF